MGTAAGSDRGGAIYLIGYELLGWPKGRPQRAIEVTVAQFEVGRIVRMVLG